MNSKAEVQPNPIAPLSANNHNDEDEINLAELFSVLWDSKWLISIIAALSFFFGYAYTHIATPIYTINSLIQIPNKSSSGALAGLSLLGANFGTQNPIQSEMTIITSRKVIEHIVDKMRLDIVAIPHYLPLLGASMARRHEDAEEGIAAPPFNLAFYNLKRYAWGGEKITVDTLDIPTKYLGKGFILIAEEPGFYRIIDPTEDRKTILEGQVGQTFSYIDDAGTWTVLVSELNARPGTEFILTRNKKLQAIQSLQSQVTIDGKKGQDLIELSLQGSKPKYLLDLLTAIIDKYLAVNEELSSLSGDEKTLEFFHNELKDVKARLNIAETRRKNFNLKHRAVDLSSQTSALVQRIAELENSIFSMQQKREELIRRFTPAHPTIATLDTQIASTKRLLAKLNRKTTKLPKAQQELVNIERDIAIANKLYATIVENLQKMEAAKATSGGSARVIDPPMLPIKPIKPKKKLILAVSMVVGLFLGIFLAFIRNLFTKIKNPNFIETRFGIPVYAAVPYSKAQKRLTRRGKAPILAAIRPDEAIVSLRYLRNSLFLTVKEAQNNIILVTSSRAGTGKSFVSINLATLLANADKQVLIIDANLHHSSIHQYFGVKSEPGLLDVITDSVPLEEAIHSNPLETISLDVLTSGKIVPNASDLLLHEQFSDLLDQFSKEYDYIIIDAPPILTTTDTAILSSLAGTTLMVLKTNMHSVSEIEDSFKQLNQVGIKPHSIVFNQVDLKKYGKKYT